MKRYVLAAVLAAAAGSLWAQQPLSPEERIAALEKKLSEITAKYESEIAHLQEEIAALKADREGTPSAGAAQAALLPPSSSAPERSLWSSELNPAISLIPDFTFSAGNDPLWKEAEALNVREVEVAFSAAIDPYARASAALSLEDGEFSAEEVYASFPALPGGFSAKLGKFYLDFGKTNGQHLHTWFQADKPLALRDFLGEEPFSGTGLSLNRVLPTAWASDLTLEVTGGKNEGVFGGRRSDLAYLLAWRNYWDLSDASNLEVQLSAIQGRNEERKRTTLGNLAVTWRYRSDLSRREGLMWRTEILREHYRTEDGLLHANGAFSFVDWQFRRGWFFGVRGDYAEHPLNPQEHDKGGALVLTWYPSEYQKLRMQVQRTSYAGIGSKNAMVFEYGFSLGPHGAHPF